MQRGLFICAVVAMAVPVWAAVDYFQTTGDGCFDTYYSEGYSDRGASTQTRLGRYNQDIGWMAWDAKDSTGVQHTAAGVNSGQTMTQFVAHNGGAIQSAKLYLNLGTGTVGYGMWAIESLRCGNTGVLQEDGASGGASFTGPAANITGAAEPYAFASGSGPFMVQGALNSPGSTVCTPWITPSEFGATASGWTWTSGLGAGEPIVKAQSLDYGWDANRQDVSGWALQYLLGYGDSLSSSDMARANAAGQIVNNDGAGTPLFLSGANAVSGAPRPGTAADGWYAIDLSLDLANAIVFDPACKAIVFNEFLAGSNVDWDNANVAFYTKDQNSSVAPFLVLNTVPEPVTMVLMVLGGVALIRRRA